MKQIIKATRVYSAEMPDCMEAERQLSEVDFCPPTSLQMKSFGYVPREPNGTYVESFPGGYSMMFRVDTRVVPGSVVNAETAEIVRKLEIDEDRKVGRKEKREIKEGVKMKLMTGSLIRTSLTPVLVSTEHNLIIVATSNKAISDDAISRLVYILESLKTLTIHVSDVRQGLTTRLRRWLGMDGEEAPETAFDGLNPVDEIVMTCAEQKLTVKMSDPTQAEMALKEALTRGFDVKSMGFYIPEGPSLKLSADLRFHAISSSYQPVEGDEEEPDYKSQISLEVSDVCKAVKTFSEMFHSKEE